MNITKDFIKSVSVNDASVKNGADLVRKKSFTKLMMDKDQTFIGGECKGSGKNPYLCSADFIDESVPVFRCTCPSRQIPCKHVIGLLWAFAEGHAFLEEAVPEEIVVKRENKEKRVTKAKEKAKSETPKEKTAAWKKSAIKKIDVQLTGIAEAEKILYNIAQAGLGAMDAKNIRTYSNVVKQLDSYAITGVQNELNELLGLASSHNSGRDTEEQVAYSSLLEKISQIHTLLVRGQAYLEKKKEAPDQMDTESEIEERLGYAWKLDELAQYGLLETDTKLVQLCFQVIVEADKKQFVDEAFYISLNSGRIFKTRNYRPFKALKHIKEDDSVFSVLNIPKLHVYPSQSLNPRVRWDACTFDEQVGVETCQTIQSYAQTKYVEVIKTVKNQLKNLILSPHPVALVRFNRISKTTGDHPIRFVIHGVGDDTIGLKQSTYGQNTFMFLLDRLTHSEAEDKAMLLLFDNDIETGVLSAQPLALITDDRIMRLVY